MKQLKVCENLLNQCLKAVCLNFSTGIGRKLFDFVVINNSLMRTSLIFSGPNPHISLFAVKQCWYRAVSAGVLINIFGRF